MYDPKNEAHEFVGADLAEAVEKACRHFQASQEELEIADLSGRDVFGLAGRALVVALPRGARSRPPAPRGEPRGREDWPRRERGRDREGGRERGGDRERGRGRDRERGRGPERAERREPEPLGPAAAAPRAEPEGPSEGTRVGEVSEAGEFVAGLVERMGVGPFEVEESAEDDLCIIQLRGSGAERLTGGDGRAVDAIQLLANQAAMRVGDDQPRVVVDVEGDRERREAYLEDLAQRAARRALQTGRSVALDPMNPKARRVLHVALRDAEDVATMSTGSGRYRQVVVVPKGAPEYEEAVRYSQEAARAED